MGTVIIHLINSSFIIKTIIPYLDDLIDLYKISKAQQVLISTDKTIIYPINFNFIKNANSHKYSYPLKLISHMMPCSFRWN